MPLTLVAWRGYISSDQARELVATVAVKASEANCQASEANCQASEATAPLRPRCFDRDRLSTCTFFPRPRAPTVAAIVVHGSAVDHTFDLVSLMGEKA